MFLSKWLEMELGETSFRDKYVYSAAGGTKKKKTRKLINATTYFSKGSLVCSCDRLVLTSCFNSTNALAKHLLCKGSCAHGHLLSIITVNTHFQSLQYTEND